MKTKVLYILLILLLLLCLLPAASAQAGVADELTAECSFSSNNKYKTDIPLMTDGNVSTTYALKEKDGWLEISCDRPICGLSVSVLVKSRDPWSYDLQAEDQNGKWQTIAQSKYLTDWFQIDPGTTRLRIQATGKERIRIAEIRAFGPGEKPEDVQNWQDLDKCDLMLLACLSHSGIEFVHILNAETLAQGKADGYLARHGVHCIDVAQVYHDGLVAQVSHRDVGKVEVYAFHQEVGRDEGAHARRGRQYGTVIAHACQGAGVLRLEIFGQVPDQSEFSQF